MIRLDDVWNRMNGNTVQVYFPAYITNRLSLDGIQHGHCFNCGRQLSPNELIPPGRTSRSLCPACYEILIASIPMHTCIICGNSLPQDKINSQKVLNREIANYMHEGFCRDYFTLIHSKVNGVLQLQERRCFPSAIQRPMITSENQNGQFYNFQRSLNELTPMTSYFNSHSTELLPVRDTEVQLIPNPANQYSADNDNLTIIDLPSVFNNRRF